MWPFLCNLSVKHNCFGITNFNLQSEVCVSDRSGLGANKWSSTTLIERHFNDSVISHRVTH